MAFLHRPAGTVAGHCANDNARRLFSFRAAQPNVYQRRAVQMKSSPVATSPAQAMEELRAAYASYDKAPPSQKFEFSADVLRALQDASKSGTLKKWGAGLANIKRRNVMQNELRQVGIKNPGMIATPSIRNDAAFLLAVVGSTSILAVLAGVFLPGDWGYFSSYLIGGISLAVLAVGSTAPGLLQFAIDSFSLVFPDYKERVTRHEAGHFLVGYLAACPITSYSILLGKERVEFAEMKIQKRLIEKNFEDDEIDSLAIVAVGGIAAEGQWSEEVMGQTADLIDLQRILLRSKTRLTDAAQQNMTRWAVYAAASLLRQYKKEHEALIAAMTRGASVLECIEAIEAVPRD